MWQVVELLFDKLIEFLDMTGWNGDELRIAGHSLGSQVCLFYLTVHL